MTALKVPTTRGDGPGDLVVSIAVFSVGAGVEIHVSLDSTYFTGDGSWVDGTSTVQLFDMIAHAAVAEALAQGYFSCPANCNNLLPIAAVVVPACVKRSGQGAATHFTACGGSTVCIRQCAVCCGSGGGSPDIQVVGSLLSPLGSAGCTLGGSGCEATCP